MTIRIQCERLHYTMNEHLRCIGLDQWHLEIPAVAWFMRSGFHSAIGTSPGALVYGRDMILLNKKKVEFSNDARQKRQQKDLEREYKKRIDHVYQRLGVIRE